MKKAIIFIVMIFIATAARGADDKRYTVPLDNSPAQGSKNAAVTIVEFIDYQ